MGKLYKKLCIYGQGDYYPYHMPGHKRHKMGDIPAEITNIDVTETADFDNLHRPEGLLGELQKRAAALYGAEESFYLINGSTCGILSAISAAVPVGGHILMARNCHKSAYHAVYLRNLTVSYLYPPIMEEYDIYDAVTARQVCEELEKNKDISAVLIVSPTYEGRIANIREIAETVHEKGIPLIVDEAHGAHLGFEEHFAENSCRLGADIVIHSVHKTLPALTQTALLHVNGSRINRNLLRRFLNIYQSSSPSYVLMASIDDALEIVEKRGKELFCNFADSYLKMEAELSKCRRLKVVDARDGHQDIGKLIISTKKTELSGQRLYDILIQKYHLQLEMAAGSYCLAMFTAGDYPEAYERIVCALLEIDGMLEGGELLEREYFSENRGLNERDMALEEVIPDRMDEIMRSGFLPEIPLAKAWDMNTELISLKDAAGRYAGEFVGLYPPGVPILAPGEIISNDIYRIIASYLRQGLTVQGIWRKKGLYEIRVLQ